MKASEFREKTVEELRVELLSILEEQFKLRMQATSGQQVPSHLFKQARRNIARIKTVLRERRMDN